MANPNLPKSLPQLISASVNSCDPDIRQVLLSNVVLGGGGSLFTGLADRLNNELNRIFNHVGRWQLLNTREVSQTPRLKFMPPVTRQNDVTVAGLEVVSLRAWVRFTNFG